MALLFRCFVNIGAERIELGYDPAKKEDPFKPVQTSRPIDFYEATCTVEGVVFRSVSEESMRAAVQSLQKKLPEGAVR